MSQARKPTSTLSSASKLDVQKILRRKTKLVGECWIWQGTFLRGGYGGVTYHGRSYQAHRLAYLVFHGEIPDGQVVRHICDTPACCCPLHLELGSAQDNSNDAAARGRPLGRKPKECPHTFVRHGRDPDGIHYAYFCRECGKQIGA